MLIAVKERGAGKSRLALQLPEPERVALVRTMLARVLGAARRAPSVGQVIVLSPERDQVPADVPVLADSGSGLNEALQQALRVLQRLGVREFLALPGDLPTLDSTDVEALIQAGRLTGCALAPDRAGSGTNGLYYAGRAAFTFQFGAGSFALHTAEAQRLEMQPAILGRAGLEFDIDLPSDLDLWRRQCLALPQQA